VGELTESEMDNLEQWEEKLVTKYDVVGFSIRRMHDREQCCTWPKKIGEALSSGSFQVDV
jgi:hypothetical protein